MTQIRMELEQARASGALPPLSEEPAALDTHMTILRTHIDLKTAEKTPRLGAAGQQRWRELEHVVRLRGALCADWLATLGYRQDEIARRLGVSARTLRSWREVPNATRTAPPCATTDSAPPNANLEVQPAAAPEPQPLPSRGRPLTQASPGQRGFVQSWLQEVGPGVGVPTLRNRFSDLARAELDTLVKEARRAWRLANLRTLHVLHWRRPGAVWAADFAQAPCLIDDRYPYVLAVRDLASGLQLCWQPVLAPTAEVFLGELSLLFARFGAPWVLKTDNGSAFIAGVVRWYLHRCHVYQLYSPPHCPEYNGAIEASIGAAKQRTERYSELAGRPGQWRSSDHDSALLEANTLTCPRRLHGLTPQQTWDARPPLTMEERVRFDATVAQCQIEARREHGLSLEESLTRREQAAVDRVAFPRALVAHDLLLFRRRSIPPRITRPKLAIGV